MKKVLFLLLLVVVALAVTPLFLPSTLYVEDEYVFDEDLSTVYQHFYDMKKYTQFEQWAKGDTDISLEYSTPSSGPNAYYAWTSQNEETSNGKVQISDSKLDQFINYAFNVGESKGNVSEVIFQEMEDEKTRVIWSFESAKVNYPFQVFNVLMKNSVKENLSQAFVKLDSILAQEKIENKEPFTIKNVTAKRLFGVMQTTSLDQQELNTATAETFGLVKSYLIDANDLTLEDLSKPVILWKLYNVEDNKAMFYCGYFIEAEVPEKDGLEYVELEAGRVISTIHQGSYLNLPNTYADMRAYATSKGFELSRDAYDVHLNTPEDVRVDSELRTEINIPIIE